ncbi:LytR/AlgR family response regulator transcription factor [Ohtaekwangia kribbensis]|uniref:LytR/AlgR family response regulator transcription factor n=1 Tax=Ohtaekwangia kribbensis TaxID=688913 RepID=A0ABW3K6Q8_9BACT
MNTKLRCLLLDDELPGLTYLKMLCEQLPELEVVKAFNSPDIFLKEVPNLDFDLCILDIEMPAMNGLHVANLLQGKPVIFVTAYKEFAAEAFDLDAIDYVRKPVKKERLQQAIQKAVSRISKSSSAKNFVQLNTDKGKALLFFDQVGYIKTSDSDSRDKTVQLLDGTILTLKNISFEKLLEVLPSDQFSRVNKKELVAIKSVHFFSHDEITTSIPQPSGKPLVLTLSESYRQEFIGKVRV